MAEVAFLDGTFINSETRPYFVAEVNTSHFGNLDAAKELICAAKESRADCVKFQSWTPGTLYSNEFLQSNTVSSRVYSKFSLREEQLHELALYSQSVGISFASTPYSLKEVDLLASLPNVPFIKVASMDAVYHTFLEYIGAQEMPVVLSTGMCDIAEIESAVAVLAKSGCRELVILHCVSIYPHGLSMASTRNVLGLRRRFPDRVIGYSDHTVGWVAAAAAVSMGAQVIEKHLTLDKTKVGFDNQMASEPEEFAELVQVCTNMCESFGGEERIISDIEAEQRINMRRSLTALKNIEPNELLSLENLGALRPGAGIPAKALPKYLGKRVQKKIQAGEQLEDGDVYL